MTSTGVGGDRNSFRVPIMADGLRAWSFGLLDCFSDLPTCMYDLWSTTYRRLQISGSLTTLGVLSAFCCCYVYSRNKQRFVHLEMQGAPLREPVGRYNQDCISWCLLQGCCCAGWGLQVRSSWSYPWMPNHRCGFSHRRPSRALMCAGDMESAVKHAMTSL
jgi:hypothetical protein